MRLVFEHEQDHESQWAAINSIAGKSGMTAETLCKWVRQAERDAGRRPGLSTEERERLGKLEKENKELRRANEILKAASAFFGPELDRRRKWWSPSSTTTESAGGVEPICRVLPIAPSTYHASKKRLPSNRALRDEYLKVEIKRGGRPTSRSTEPERSTVR